MHLKQDPKLNFRLASATIIYVEVKHEQSKEQNRLLNELPQA